MKQRRNDKPRWRIINVRAGALHVELASKVSCIGQIPPGDYYIVAFDRTENGGLPAADLPASIIPMASSVRVEAGSTASVDLRMNRWPW